jgi:hypothetical protein
MRESVVAALVAGGLSLGANGDPAGWIVAVGAVAIEAYRMQTTADEP